MAKKEEFDLDDLDIDWDGFDEPEPQQDESRNPIVRVAKKAGRSALAAVWPRGRRDQVILKGLPKEATDAYDGYRDVADVTKDVFAHTKEEVLKTERGLKIQARQMLPTLKRYLPDALTDKIGNWSKGDDRGPDNYDPKQATIDRSMAEIFNGVNPEEVVRPTRPTVEDREAQKEEQEDYTTERLRSSIRDMKNDALTDVVIGIGKDVHTSTSLASGIFTNVYRKQIELQYRTLFAIQDIGKLKQTEFDRNAPALEAIVKNTALPDYAKEEFSEIRWANIKRQAADWVNPLRYADGFVNQIRENAKKKITQGFTEGRGLLDMILGMSADDDFGMSDSGALSPEQRRRNTTDKASGLLGGQLGRMLLQPLVNKAQNRSRDWLEENPQAMDYFNRAKYFGTNLSSISNSAIAEEDNDSKLGGFFRFLNQAGIVKPLSRETAFLDERNPETLNRAGRFDHRTWLSLNEVYPAWFSRINQSILSLRGKSDDSVYDITTRGFVDRKVVGNRVRKYVADDSSRDRMRDTIDSVVNYVDKDKTLTEEERQGVGKYLEDRAARGRTIDVKALREDNGTLARFMSSKAADKVMSSLTNRADNAKGGDYQISNEMQEHLRRIQGHIQQRQTRVDGAVQQYGEQALRDAGIFTYDADKDVFGADKDLSNPYTQFNDLETGKTNAGYSRRRLEAVRDKLLKGSATTELLKGRYNLNEINNILKGMDDAKRRSSEENKDEDLNEIINTRGQGGRGKGITQPQLIRALYGKNKTSFPVMFNDLKESLKSLKVTLKPSDVPTPSSSPTVTANFDSKPLVDAITNYNPNAELLGIMRDHLKHLDEVGVNVLNWPDGFGFNDEEDSKGKRRRKRKKRRGGRRNPLPDDAGLFRRWWRLSTDTVESTVNTAGRWAHKLGDSAMAGGRRLAGMFNRGPSDGPGFIRRQLGKLPGGVKNVFSGAGSFLKGLRSARDIYNGEGKCVLKGKALAAGEYWQKDAEGKPTQLFKLADIRLGFDIVDQAGNIILSAEDLASGGELSYYTGTRWKKLFDRVGTGVGRLANKAFNIPVSVLEFAKGKANSVLKWGVNLPDIYIEGEERPRLLSDRMRKGEYRLASDKSTIYRPEQITGEVVDSKDNIIISQEEYDNPNFKLVDKYGRKVATPIGRAFGRVANAAKFVKTQAGKIPGRIKAALEKMKDYATDNPVTRWFKKERKPGGGILSGNSLSVGGSTGRKANYILARIWKLLNSRLSGDKEDDAWTEQFLKDGPSSSSLAGLRRRAGEARDKVKDLFGKRKKLNNALANRYNRLKGWLNGKADKNRRLGKFRDRFRGLRDRYKPEGSAKDIAKNLAGRSSRFTRRQINRMRNPMFDIGTRYGVEQRLSGRDDDTAQFYRDKLYSRGRLSPNKLKRNAASAARDARDAAANVLSNGKKSVKTGWDKLGLKLDRMINLQEITWFNNMRETISSAGGPSGLIRGMIDKFGRRNKFGQNDEKKGYFQFFRRWQEKRADRKAKGDSKEEKKSGAMGNALAALGGIGTLLGGLGTTLSFISKWFVFKPLEMADKLVAWGGRKLLTGAATSIVRPIVTAAATAGGAVIATLGWPVTLAVGALAAVGYTAYSIATTTYTDYLDKMRLAQYGFQDYDKWSSDDGAKARYMEDQLKGYVIYNEHGQATLRGVSAEDVTGLAEGFGIDKDDKEALLSFHGFMLQRFIPIYLRWMTAVRSAPNDVALADLGDARKVSKKDMLQIFNATRLSKDAKPLQAISDPRSVNPGFWSSLWNSLPFTEPNLLEPSEVMEVQDDVRDEINARMADKLQEMVTGKKLDTSEDGIRSTGIEDSLKILSGYDKQRRDNTPKTLGWETGDEQVEMQVSHDVPIDVNDVNALQSIRMKAYGLNNLDPANVKAMLALESFVLPSVNPTNGTYKGSWQEAIDTIAPGGSKGDKAESLRYWFQYRFLPVFVTYIIAVKRYVPAANPLDLKLTGGYLYEVGRLTANAYYMRNDVRQSVWDVKVNPLDDTDVNSDIGSVSRELATLKALSKQSDLAVSNLLDETKTKMKRAQWGDKDRGKGIFQGNAERNDDTIKGYADGSEDAARADGLGYGGRERPGISYTNGSGLDHAVSDAGGIQRYVDLTTGQGTVDVSQGTGEGNYAKMQNAYPRATLQNIDKVKEMIVDAARDVGVPPALGLGMAQAESNFNIGVKSSSSSATGLYQFITDTWNGELRKYGQQFGLPKNADRTDPYANTLLGLNFIKNNIEQAEKDYGGKVPAGVAYMYHFLGPGNGKKFMQAYKQNPSMLGTQAPLSKLDSVVSANKSIFYTKDGQPRTLAEILQLMTRKVTGGAGNNFNTASDKIRQAAIDGNTTSSEPSVNQGAPALDGTGKTPADATQNLPANNAERKDGVLAQQGAQKAADETSQAQANTSPAMPTSTASGSPVPQPLNSGDRVESDAVAGGMSAEDAAKVRAGYEKQQEKIQVAAAAPKSAEPTTTDNTIAGQQLTVQRQMLEMLQAINTSVSNIVQARSAAPQAAQPPAAVQQAQASASGRPAPNGNLQQPAPTLNVGRPR